MNPPMPDLLRARAATDRAIECVRTAGEHLSFVCHVAEFVREARAAMTKQCDAILQEALEHEITLLQQDRSLVLPFPNSSVLLLANSRVPQLLLNLSRPVCVVVEQKTVVVAQKT